jgi:hypothetical protein
LQSELAKFGFPSADIANFAVRIVEAALACNWVGDGLFASSGKVGYPGTVSTADASPEKLFLHLSNSSCAYIFLGRYIAVSFCEHLRRGWHLLGRYKLLCAGRKKELG